jgi:pimeloyl-ACP methyl ester carboxylesterase
MKPRLSTVTRSPSPRPATARIERPEDLPAPREATGTATHKVAPHDDDRFVVLAESMQRTFEGQRRSTRCLPYPVRKNVARLVLRGRIKSEKRTNAALRAKGFEAKDVEIVVDNKRLGSVRVYDWSAAEAVKKLATGHGNGVGTAEHARAELGLSGRSDKADTRPPVVVIHGLFGTAVNHWDMMHELRKEHPRIIAIDLPGHGDSELADGVELDAETMRQMILPALDSVIGAGETVIVYGNSLGGACAARYCAARDDRIAGVVLASPAGAFIDDRAQHSALTRFHHPGPFRTVQRWMEDLLELPNIDARSRKARTMRTVGAMAFEQLIRRPHIQSLMRSVGNDDALTPDELETIAHKTLLVWGKEDRTLPRAYLKYFRAHLTSARGDAVVEEPDDFGHYPGMYKPREMARKIVAHADAMMASPQVNVDDTEA